jgi:nitrate reductase cytochrome c-type subunit
MNKAWLPALGLAFLMVLVAQAPDTPATAGSGGGIPDDMIGLVHQDIRAVPAPEAVHDNLSDPGERPLPQRWNDVSPPVIPHGIADFLPITRTNNMCLDCHATTEKTAGEPTPIPQSHYQDLRNAPQALRETIAGARYVCTSCHVPQTEADPLPMEPR